MSIQVDTFTYDDELDLIKMLAKDFIAEAKDKTDWFGEPMSFFTEDIVKAVKRDQDYQDMPFHLVGQDEIYDICEELFLTCNWVWTEDWHGQHFGPRSY